MNRDNILKALEKSESEYIWTLYYYKINRRRNNPYVAYKVKFKQESYLIGYAHNLMASVKAYQFDKISDVQEYNGANSKISCDYLSVDNDLIKENWNNFFNSIINPTTEKFKEKVHGYLLTGTPKKEGEKSITFFKVGNPIVKLSTNKARFFISNEEELDTITDDFCRLYLTADFIVYDSVLYTFNLNFERVFDIEKTMKKIKEKAITTIVDTDVIADIEQFKIQAKEYRSARTFITLAQDRIDLIKNTEQRIDIANKLKLTLDENNKFVLDDSEKASRFIRFLCYKFFPDFNAESIVEVSNATKLSI